MLLRTPAAALRDFCGSSRRTGAFFARTRHDAGKTPRLKDGENPWENTLLSTARWVTAEPAATAIPAAIPAQMPAAASAASGTYSGPGLARRRLPPRPYKR